MEANSPWGETGINCLNMQLKILKIPNLLVGGHSVTERTFYNLKNFHYQYKFVGGISNFIPVEM